jgi:hypothetical protein
VRCDPATVEKLISLTHRKPVILLPLFAMAGITLKTYRESHFPPITPIPQVGDRLVEDVRKDINHTVAPVPNPSAKVEWMNRQIRREVVSVADECAAVQTRMAGVEASMDGLAVRLRDVMRESVAALDQIEDAEVTLNAVFQDHQKVQGSTRRSARSYSASRGTRAQQCGSECCSRSSDSCECFGTTK